MINNFRTERTLNLIYAVKKLLSIDFANLISKFISGSYNSRGTVVNLFKNKSSFNFSQISLKLSITWLLRFINDLVLKSCSIF